MTLIESKILEWYPPSVPFNIEYMWLSIEANLESQTIHGRQQLKLSANKELDIIELDCSSEIKIDSIFLSYAEDTDAVSIPVKYNSIENNKLRIQLKDVMPKNSIFHIIINYNVIKPSRGFYFITFERNETKEYQAWTQGEPIDSKYWFPTYDHPQMKFPRQISVIVPKEYTVISNGELDIIETSNHSDDYVIKRKFVWQLSEPNPAYLTAIIIGKFSETSKGYNYDNRVPLRYYVPKERENDADRTFKDSPKMMKFFEMYFGTLYPYNKYSQVVVKQFPYGGMENTTCTVLYEDVLHDEIAHYDYTSDDVISHELAHHWFGDLVTCRDWEHIWLNEGFASYSEALYLEHDKGVKEHLYYMLQAADLYFDDVLVNGKRALATKQYRHPDEIFDFGHTYKKGQWIVHMIRNSIGNEEFKKALKIYLERYRDKTAEIDDIRQIFEEVSGKGLGRFFDQWLFKPGHLKLKIQIVKDDDKLLIKLIQEQEESTFEYNADIKIVYASNGGNKKIVNEAFLISTSEFEKVFQIPQNYEIDWISIDPEYKLLREINYDNIPISMFINKIRDRNNTTIIERIEALRHLRELSTPDMIEFLKRTILEEDLDLPETFWGVSLEAVKTIGNIQTDQKYNALIECLNSVDNTKVKTEVLKNLITDSNSDLLKRYIEIVNIDNESYYVREQAAIGIGQVGDENSYSILESLLNKHSWNELIAQGSITGLRKLGVRYQKSELSSKIITLLIEQSNIDMEETIRISAIDALGYFIIDQMKNINNTVYEHLINLLKDFSPNIRNRICASLTFGFKYSNNAKVIEILQGIAKHDVDGQVRRTARESIELIQTKVIPEKIISNKIESMKRNIIQR